MLFNSFGLPTGMHEEWKLSDNNSRKNTQPSKKIEYVKKNLIKYIMV